MVCNIKIIYFAKGSCFRYASTAKYPGKNKGTTLYIYCIIVNKQSKSISGMQNNDELTSTRYGIVYKSLDISEGVRG